MRHVQLVLRAVNGLVRSNQENVLRNGYKKVWELPPHGAGGRASGQQSVPSSCSAFSTLLLIFSVLFRRSGPTQAATLCVACLMRSRPGTMPSTSSSSRLRGSWVLWGARGRGAAALHNADRSQRNCMHACPLPRSCKTVHTVIVPHWL